MKRLHIFPLSLALVLFMSCSESKLPVAPVSDQLVIQAYLFANRPVKDIRISTLVPYNSQQEYIPVNDAIVTLIKNGMTFSLALAKGDSGFYAYSGNDLQVEAGDRFQLQVLHNDILATAETVVPDAPKIGTLSRDTLWYPARTSKGRGQATDSSFINVEWQKQNGRDSLYYVVIQPKESYKLPSWPENIPVPYSQESNYWRTGNKWTFYHYPIHYFNLKFAGEYVFYLYHINREYADLYKVRDVFQGKQMEAPSNIENGYGIFTAFNCDSVRFFVKFE